MATRTLYLLFACLISAVLMSCSKPDYIDSNGHSGQFSDHRGQWMVINYWAVWCKPCITEIPELNHFTQSQADKAVVFGVDYEQSATPLLQQSISKLAIEFPVLTEDPAPVLGYPRPQVLPTTLVFNPSGELVHTLLGPQTEASLLAAISE